jgi:hypothetical protein
MVIRPSAENTNLEILDIGGEGSTSPASDGCVIAQALLLGLIGFHWSSGTVIAVRSVVW